MTLCVFVLCVCVCVCVCVRVRACVCVCTGKCVLLYLDHMVHSHDVRAADTVQYYSLDKHQKTRAEPSQVLSLPENTHTQQSDNKIPCISQTAISLSLSLSSGQHIRVENCSTLTDQWLSCVGGRRPRSLALHRCRGLSVTSSGLELFLSQSKDSLEVQKK